jgi:hypothetical protein
MENKFKETLNILLKEKSKISLFLFLIFIPLIISLFHFFFDIKSLQDVTSNFIAGLSLFIGLFFSLIVVISDKVQSRKDELKNNTEINDSMIQKVEAYKNFGKNTVSIITISVYIGLLIIILLIISQYKLEILDKKNHTIILKISQSIVLYFSCVFVYFIIYILQSMYDFFYGQIDE